MGSRGPRSAMDIATTPRRNINTLDPIDIPALARAQGMRQRDVLRAVRRAERRGEAMSRLAQDGSLIRFWCE